MGSEVQADRIIIVGAGLAGCLLAVQIGQAGYEVVILERRSDPRKAGVIGGRSINLAISERGLTALQRAGLKTRLLEQAIRMPGRMIHTAEAAIYQPYSSNSEQAINSMSRSGLNFTLIEVADALKNVTLIFDSSCADIDFDAPSVTTEDGTVHKADIVIGADGAYSAVRQALQKLPDFQFQESYLDHGYKELHIPPVASGKHAPFALEPNALHIWPHGGSMMIALPNPDGSFTCTLFWPFTGEHSFEQVQSGDIYGFFREYYSDVVDLMPTLLEDFAQNPTSRLVTIRCDPWFRAESSCWGTPPMPLFPSTDKGPMLHSRTAARSPMLWKPTRMILIAQSGNFSPRESNMPTRLPIWRSKTFLKCVITLGVAFEGSGKRVRNCWAGSSLLSGHRSTTWLASRPFPTPKLARKIGDRQRYSQLLLLSA